MPFRLFAEKDEEFSVDAELSAEDVPKRLSVWCYDVVVSDYQRPVMDRIAPLKSIRSTGERYRISISPAEVGYRHEGDEL